MAYNGSGVYSLPLAARVAGELITSAWANTSFNDFATAFNSVLLRNGTQPMTAGLPGFVSALPAFTFNGETNSGMGASDNTATTIKLNFLTKGSNSLRIDADTARTPRTKLLFNQGAVENEVGWLCYPTNSQSANYTLLYEDRGYLILHPDTDANVRTFTIPANASVAYPLGTEITFINGNSGVNLNIAITSDTMRLAGAGTTGTRTLAANGVAKAVKVGTTQWLISGTGLT